jgi:hypothetical protein
MSECFLCCETFNASTRREVKCQYCDYSTCLNCLRIYLLGKDGESGGEPMCMHPDCKKVWSSEYLATHTPKSFYNDEYRIHKAKITLELEKSLLPDTQPIVEREKRKEEMGFQIRELQIQQSELQHALDIVTGRIRGITREKRDLEEFGHLSTEEEKYDVKIICPCPVNDCRGFIKRDRKCGLCEIKICGKCREIKGEDHECKESDVENVALLKRDTKACPNCAKPIYKVSGCDHMWCTQCRTAFSWNRGTILRGNNTNPHFYDWQRANNGGQAPRVPGDDPGACGGLIGTYQITQICGRVGIPTTSEIHQEMYDIHRLIGHILDIEIPYYPANARMDDNVDLRVKYLMGQISEDQWISFLKKREKKREKNLEINQVLDMFVQASTDTLNSIQHVRKRQDILNILQAMNDLRNYTNIAFIKIVARFGGVAPTLKKESWDIQGGRPTRGRN